MSYSSDVSRGTCGRLRRVVGSSSLVAFTVLALVAATGCGSDSKPAYCTDRSNLEQSVKDLPGAVTSGVSGLQAQVTKVEGDANTLVDAAKSDFPTETDALKSSVASLKTAVQGLPSSPSAADLAPIALDAKAVVSAVSGFTSATKSKCD